VFDIVLNREHTVVQDLDIFAKVGRGAAHDEIVPFQVRNGKFQVNGENSDIVNGKIMVEFVKVGIEILVSRIDIEEFQQICEEL